MRHGVDGRKFGRNSSHRIALFRALSNSLIENEYIVTTAEKAKEVRRVVDRLISIAKRGDSSIAARRVLFSRTRSKGSVSKVCDNLSKRYLKRAGGYTRVLRLDARRVGDGAEMALVELVDRPL